MGILALIVFSCFCFGGQLARTSVGDKALTGQSYGSEAIAVSGGLPASINQPETTPWAIEVELIVPKTGESCILPRLPFGTAWHCMNGLTLCGGAKYCEDCTTDDLNEYCMKFSDGEWSLSSLLHPWLRPLGWETDKGIYLIGGDKDNESEFVPNNGEPHSPAFPVKYETRMSCSITDVGSHSVIITGGGFYDGEGHNIDRVTRYDEDGFVENLPSLLFGRYGHGCGSFLRDDGTQVFLVAGGSDAATGLSSTEVLTPGSDTWRLATPLPYTRAGMAGVTINNRLYMTGGVTDYGNSYWLNSTNPTDEILEWRDEEQVWGLGLRMENARSAHAASSVTIDDNIMKYCH